MSAKPLITPEMISGMQGFVPSVLATCSANGVSNITYISQIFYVDDQHIAFSAQLLNKTWQNLEENRLATAMITAADFSQMWKLHLEFIEQQTSGELFDDMDMQLQAIAAYIPSNINFKLTGAMLCRVIDVELVV
ncbi:MAG: pyridoxamine 5'-phosphate oxidase family protein [Bacteroidota bacterium]